MRKDVADTLRRINREFYQTFASEFASTRRRLQPGVVRALHSVSELSHVLDLGCGPGELAHGLARRGFRGTYLGIDASPRMIDLAREHASFPWARFFVADLVEDDWSTQLTSRYDHIFLLATLHHVPCDPERKRLLARIAASLTSDGTLTLSVWDFYATARMRRRVLSWDSVGLTQSDVDPGDHLLDWRHGGQGVRYVHLFTDDELSALARDTGFQVVDRYASDGEGGRLGLYQVWTISPSARTPLGR
jgi:tRNA (uracil-5-)-methyltransferase TRM9